MERYGTSNMSEEDVSYYAKAECNQAPKAVPITDQLAKANAEHIKRLDDMLNRAGRLNERLLGPVAQESNEATKNTKTLVQVRSSVDQLVNQSRVIATKLDTLSSLLGRLESI